MTDILAAELDRRGADPTWSEVTVLQLPAHDWSYVEPDDSYTGEATRTVAWWLSVTATTLAAFAAALVLALVVRRFR